MGGIEWMNEEQHQQLCAVLCGWMKERKRPKQLVHTVPANTANSKKKEDDEDSIQFFFLEIGINNNNNNRLQDTTISKTTTELENTMRSSLLSHIKE